MERIFEFAFADEHICEVIFDMRLESPGNGSVWVSGKARIDHSPALLKLGARTVEREWMTGIDSTTAGVVPRVFGSGEMHGVGWLVLERCSEQLDRNSNINIARVITSVAGSQQAGRTVASSADHMDAQWLRVHLEGARAQACPGGLSHAIRDLERAWAFARAECGLTVNHGDVHFQNVVARHQDGPALLIDPMPISTVWAWDAAYLQATLAPYRTELARERLRLVDDLARSRRALGLPTADRLDRVEQLVLGWAAALWWNIAPWRHEHASWRRWVEQRVRELGSWPTQGI